MWKSKFYDAFVLNHIVVLHAIDATPARWRGDADSSPLDGTSAATPSLRNDLVKNCRVHLTHWLISTQVKGDVCHEEVECKAFSYECILCQPGEECDSNYNVETEKGEDLCGNQNFTARSS